MPRKSTKEQKIEEFLQQLGGVTGKGFTIICNACKSTNVIPYDDTDCGGEYTGCWGGAGIKCLDCGNSQEVMSM